MCVQKTTFFERFQGRLKEAHLIFKNSNRWRTSNIMDIFNYHSSKVKVRAQQNVPGSENALNFAIFDVNENPCNAYFFLFHFGGIHIWRHGLGGGGGRQKVQSSTYIVKRVTREREGVKNDEKSSDIICELWMLPSCKCTHEHIP